MEHCKFFFPNPPEQTANILIAKFIIGQWFLLVTALMPGVAQAGENWFLFTFKRKRPDIMIILTEEVDRWDDGSRAIVFGLQRLGPW